MKIRSKLTLKFTGIVALILLIFSTAVFYLSEINRYNVFEDRLAERALNTARMFLEVDEIDEKLLKTLRRNYLKSLPSEFVRIYDKNYKPVFIDDTIKYHFDKDWLSKIQKEGISSYEDGNRQVVGIFYSDNQGDFLIVASAIDWYGHKKVSNLEAVLTAGYFISLIIVFFLGQIFAREALKPIQKVVSQVQKISASNLHLRVDEGNGKDEISDLAITFNTMFTRIETAFELQKTFVSNASHELRTPLTTITGEISVALMKDRTVDEYKEILESSLEEAKELTKLINDLLELAQTGVDANSVLMSNLDLSETIRKATDETLRRKPDAMLNLNMAKTFPNGPIVFGNEKLLLTCLLNIIGNAFKFSEDKEVLIDFSFNDHEACIAITDKGFGISEEELKNIFVPFYRSERSGNLPGHGIGLPLTMKIVNIHRGRIEVQSAPDKGTTFYIFLPVLFI
ncbi:MAG: HAMP domain-containing protein [Sporocytophaga sp.]|uniref:sensor histidine kinase n=1 Tax=Sporocytophaga sp. TaxID=2231183 RepID=UPI001B155BC3|nr:ATP-binding protein [Sporocytophaga sp.]MBO9701549.1 HAMP domain-containing protein [Sporocytophaga sp.]